MTRSRFSMAAYHETREVRRTRRMSHGLYALPTLSGRGEVAEKEREESLRPSGRAARGTETRQRRRKMKKVVKERGD